MPTYLDWSITTKVNEKILIVPHNFSSAEIIEGSSAQSAGQQALQRCNFLFGQALDADERQLPEIAIDLYGQTAEYALRMVSLVKD